MKGVVVIDTNLMVLLVVGSASRSYIHKHKRLSEYTTDDFDLLGLILSEFSKIVLLPHIMAEVSNVARQIDSPAKGQVLAAMRTLVTTCVEFPIHSASGVHRAEFGRLGLTDAVILHFCTLNVNGIHPTLLTSDRELAIRARSLGYSVIDYRSEFLSS
jgi:hypothetical protein